VHARSSTVIVCLFAAVSGAWRVAWTGGYCSMADPPRRVNFFSGMVLTASDLAVEQEYHRGMRYLHNHLHGHGTVTGLDVTVTSGGVVVSPGVAIDACGREIVVAQPMTVRVQPRRDTRGWVRDLVIEWHETAAGPVPGPEGATAFTRWVEDPQLSLVARGKGPSHALVLARLTRSTRGVVQVDTSMRRPLGPA